MKMNRTIKIYCAAAALSCWVALPATNAFSEEETAAEPTPSLFQILDEKVSIGAAIEVEASSGSDYEGTNSSDITLSTMELGIEAEINDWVSGKLVLLWEEDDTEPVDLDEATITIGNADEFPAFLTAGRMTMPFGVFETNMISDTLGCELGETGGTGLLLGTEMSGFYGSVYTFNGDVNETGADDGVKTAGISAGYNFENDTMAVNAGIDWINNISDSDGLSGTLSEDIETKIAGIAAHITASFGPFSLMAEHVAAQDEYTAEELPFRDQGAQPTATSVEAAFGFEAIGKEAVVAVGYQTTSEALTLELPETRMLAAAGIEIFERTSLAIEYLHDEDYGTNDGGSGETADQVTMLLAVEFKKKLNLPEISAGFCRAVNLSSGVRSENPVQIKPAPVTTLLASSFCSNGSDS